MFIINIFRMRDQRPACWRGSRCARAGGAVPVVSLRARRVVVRQARLPRAALRARTSAHAARWMLPALHTSYVRQISAWYVILILSFSNGVKTFHGRKVDVEEGQCGFVCNHGIKDMTKTCSLVFFIIYY